MALLLSWTAMTTWHVSLSLLDHIPGHCSPNIQTDNIGYGGDLRRQGNKDVLDGNLTFRESFKEMMDSVTTPYPECIQYLCDNIKLDPYFKEFYTWSRENNVPVIVLSSGMVPIIRALLVHLVGPEAEDIEIVANDVADRPGKKQDQTGGWEIKFHDDSDFGHDKSLAIRPYADHIAKLPENDRPTLLYAGDGVSDLSAARETDLLFAKKGKDLVTYCEREGVPFTLFEDWKSILETLKDIHSGKKSLEKVAGEGAEEAKQEGKEKETTK
ncbi:phosphoserine phosphatase [Lasallia pustulata]|uniref:Phosphoserine phosphatase n=1 Tax=Lasallia pustulata TaxID=136370 RepID=A0A1W5DAU8_9LECA|nr:phosphoserine phosphatase [Lasallia pustulata]